MFGEQTPHYPVIASNRRESTAATLQWYRQRGETSENGIKELKIGFGLERMPCGRFAANAAFLRIGAIAHNLQPFRVVQALGARRWALGAGWPRHRVAADAVPWLREIRAASFAQARALSP